MANPLDIFRIVAAEFKDMDDATVEVWIDLTAPLISRNRFGKIYEQCLALLTAHRIKVAQEAAASAEGDGVDDIGGVGAAFKVASYSAGGESISFNSSSLTAKPNPDAEFTQTVYGIQYLTLRDLYAIPIINAGERRLI